MDILPFFIYLILPFVFLILALRQYPPGYENLKIFFYAISFVCFSLAAMMFVMQGEDGVVIQVDYKPPVNTRVSIVCDNSVFLDPTDYMRFQNAKLPFADGTGDTPVNILLFDHGRDCLPVDQNLNTGFILHENTTSTFMIEGPGIVIPRSMRDASNEAVAQFGFESPYVYGTYGLDRYYLIHPDGAYGSILPLVVLYGGFGTVMLVFAISEIMTIRWNRSTI